MSDLITEGWLPQVGFDRVPSDVLVVFEREPKPYWRIRLWHNAGGSWDVTLDGRPARAVTTQAELVHLCELLDSPLPEKPAHLT